MAHSQYNLKQLELKLMSLDKFFTLFLDRFEKQMNPDNPDTPIWKLYRAKTKEYHRVSTDIRIARYYDAKTV